MSSGKPLDEGRVSKKKSKNLLYILLLEWKSEWAKTTFLLSFKKVKHVCPESDLQVSFNHSVFLSLSLSLSLSPSLSSSLSLSLSLFHSLSHSLSGVLGFCFNNSRKLKGVDVGLKERNGNVARQQGVGWGDSFVCPMGQCASARKHGSTLLFINAFIGLSTRRVRQPICSCQPYIQRPLTEYYEHVCVYRHN